MMEVRFSGFGGQGIVRCALITGKAISLYDDKYATMTQSFGPEARGGACSSQLVVSENRVLYPYVTVPGVLVALSQEAYNKYEPELGNGGILIVEQDLVKQKPDTGRVQIFPIPATRIAEELGNRLFANLVVIGFFAAVTKCVTPDAVKKALPELVPGRFLKANMQAFDKGYAYGNDLMATKAGADKMAEVCEAVE
ncbi:2-oxoglutarate synthase subunit KorC [Rhodospirillaceae bacterium LM-1]|nr:2-oxoglutarate synthase subunit KorC [Rhodospirillaceae bacterium LM-1]